MLDTLINFFVNGVLNLILKLPVNPFSWDQYILSINPYLEALNYFVPFYALAPIINAWLAMVSTSIGVYITIKIVLKGV